MVSRSAAQTSHGSCHLGETIITDGPSAEIKEQLGGYTIIECADLDEALKWAAIIPAARDASVEVRPIVATQAPV